MTAKLGVNENKIFPLVAWMTFVNQVMKRLRN